MARPVGHIVVIGSSSTAIRLVEELERAGEQVLVLVVEDEPVGAAAYLLAVTDNDAANLEIGLVAQGIRPDLSIVTRLFDHDLAGRVENRLHLGTTRSVSMVAAPAFAAAALGRRTEVVYSIGRRVVIFTELQVKSGSVADEGVDPAGIDQPGAIRLLAVQRSGRAWDWGWRTRSSTLAVGDRIAVAATRGGLAALLQRIKPMTEEEHDGR